MSFFRFVFLSEPSAAAENAADIACGRIEAWVKENDAESAEAKARAYIMDYSWIVKELELAEPWPDELCPDPEIQPVQARLYNKAERQGIAVLIQAWPKVDRPGQYEFGSLGKPLTPDGKH